MEEFTYEELMERYNSVTLLLLTILTKQGGQMQVKMDDMDTVQEGTLLATDIDEVADAVNLSLILPHEAARILQ